MRRFRFASGFAAALLAVTCAIGTAAAPLERRIEHPDGTSLLLKGIDLRPDSIVLSVTIANPGSREIRLNGARSLVITDDANGVHFLNPPAANPALRIPAGALLSGDLVFIGPLSPAAHQLRLASNEGIGTTDNPLDDTPILSTTVAAPPGRRGGAMAQGDHPNGASIGIISAKAGPAGCVLSLIATNGNDRAIRLNQAHSLVLEDGRGNKVAPLAPASNPDLTVAPGGEIKADLIFPCQKLDTRGTLTLTTNRGTGGTTDNPYETLPVFTVTLQPETASGGPTPNSSRASAAPVARSQLGPSGTLAQTQPPPAAAPEARETPAKPPPEQKPPAREVQPTEPLSLSELKEALKGKRTAQGIRIVLPADSLFDSQTGKLGSQADIVLPQLEELIAKTHPAEVTIAGHTDSVGDDDANQALSEERARDLGKWLAEHGGKKPPRLVEQGFGRTRPVAPNHNADGSDNPQGRAKNRRIEITLSKPAKDPAKDKDAKEQNEPDRKR